MIEDPTRPYDAETSENGQSPMPTPINQPRPGRAMPGRRDVTITMAGDYGDAGMRLKIWANYPHKLANMIQSGEEEQTAAALCQIILEHNGWEDDDGPLPQLRPPKMSSKEGDEDFEDARLAFQKFWDRLPQELAVSASTSIGLEVGKLGEAVRKRQRR